MVRKLGIVTLWLAMTLPACAADKPGVITGLVRDSSGTPQMGAAVDVLAGTTALRVFTDTKGRFSISDLAPGMYQVRASAASFLPALREKVSLAPGAHLVINLTLNTLFEAVQFLPQRPRVSQDDDDWKWILRSSANRPILRVLDDGTPVLVSESKGMGERGMRGEVVFLAGSEAEGFGASPAMGTSFRVEQSLFSSGTLSLNGDLGYGNGAAGVFRAAYSHQFENGAHPEFALTVRRFGVPGGVGPGALEAIGFSAHDSTTIADRIQLDYGGDLQAIQFGERVSAFRPFGSVSFLVRPGTMLRYRYATSEPDMRAAKGFDTAPADLSESGPRMSLVDSQPALERARHHELSLSQRLGRNNLQVAVYADQVSNAALVGVGEVGTAIPGLLPDLYSGTFSYNGGTLSTNGVRVVYARRLAADITATADYSYGGVLDLARPAADWSELQEALENVRRHSITGKLAGSVPGSKTRWIASYKWTSGEALTPVDLFNASRGQADPYLNVFLRQPLPNVSFLPARMEAIVDLRNLLAQGYIPVVAPDGQTVYLVQSARSVRGGVAFTF